MVLNCGGNSGLDGDLSPLRGMRLTFLSCWGCNVTDLSPLRGIPLTALFCASNRIADLEPLKGLPLSTLHCSGNRIASLEPLHGMKLNALHMSNNEVSQLEPLQGMALTLCSCDSNRIKNLNPLIGMPIGALVCGNNLLTTVQMFVKKPPDSFHFDCDTIPTTNWNGSATHGAATSGFPSTRATPRCSSPCEKRIGKAFASWPRSVKDTGISSSRNSCNGRRPKPSAGSSAATW